MFKMSISNRGKSKASNRELIQLVKRQLAELNKTLENLEKSSDSDCEDDSNTCIEQPMITNESYTKIHDTGTVFIPLYAPGAIQLIPLHVLGP